MFVGKTQLDRRGSSSTTVKVQSVSVTLVSDIIDSPKEYMTLHLLLIFIVTSFSPYSFIFFLSFFVLIFLSFLRDGGKKTKKGGIFDLLI